MTLDEAIAEIEKQVLILRPHMEELRGLSTLPTLAASVSGGIVALEWVLELLDQVKTGPTTPPTQNWDLP